MYLDDSSLDLLPWLRPSPTTRSSSRVPSPHPLTLLIAGSRLLLAGAVNLPGYCIRRVDSATTAAYSTALSTMVHSREKGKKAGSAGRSQGCISVSKIRKMQAEDIKFSEPGSKGVTVILFGWAGCKDRYLTKYAAFYEQAGYTTIRYTMPIVQVRGYFSYKLFAKSFYEKVFADGSNKPAQIVWHVFSMNGCSLFTGLWGLLHKLKRDDIISASKGVIFDSAPAFVRPDQSARAISMSSLPAPDFHAAVRETYRGLLLLYFASHHAMVWLRSHVESRVWERNFSYWHLQEMEMPKNSLFIYSDADDICSAESIEKIIEHQSRREGTEVHSLKLPESPHCAHLRTHPELYASACIRFVAEQDAAELSPPPPLTDPNYKLIKPSSSESRESGPVSIREVVDPVPEPSSVLSPAVSSPTAVLAV